MTALEYHPLANIFPLIEGKDFDDFCAGLKADGRLHDKIVLFEGKILDGRNRHRACEATGVTAHYRTFDPAVEGDPLAFVIAKNLRRRHLDESQRAIVALTLANMRQGERTDIVGPSANLPKVSQADAAAMLNVSERTVRTAKQVTDAAAPELTQAITRGELSVSAAADIVKAMPLEEQRALVMEVAKSDDTKRAFAGAVKELRREKQEGKKDRREGREADLGRKQLALPDKRYGVILADPEWRFEPWSRATGMDRAADNHYPTSVTEVIAARPVAAIAAVDCALFLWATAPMLPHALAVMAAWGFDYCSHLIWDKDRIGTGYWFRNQHELLLLGTRGQVPAPAMGTQWSSIVESPASRQHSEKPVWQYELIDKYFPSLPKIELNARGRRQGWDAWGLEAPAEAHPESTNSVDVSPKPDAAEAAPRFSPPPLGEGAASTPVHDDLDIPPILDRRGELST